MSVGAYGKLLLEGLDSFVDSVKSHLKDNTELPRLQLDKSFVLPSTVKISQGHTMIKEIVDQIVKEYRKKLAKAEGKKEDDLLNTSNLGMSLLTISDMNTSHDIIDTDTLLDDNLLNFDPQFTKGSSQKAYSTNPKSNLQQVFEDKDKILQGGNFSKSKKISNEASTISQGASSHLVEQLKRKQSDDRGKIRPPGGISSQKYGDGPAEVTTESEYYQSVRTISGTTGINHKRELRQMNLTKEEKKTFADLFVSRQGRSGLEEIKKSEVLKNSIDAAAHIGIKRNGSGSSSGSNENKSSKVDTPTFTSQTNGEERGQKLVGMRQSHTSKENYNLDFDVRSKAGSEIKTSILPKKAPIRSNMSSSSPQKESRSVGMQRISLNPKNDLLLTPAAKELIKTKVNHKTIPSKYHQELFKMMDSKLNSYDFSDSQMGDPGVHFISKYLKDNPEIDTLKMDNCKMTDDGLSILLYSMLDITLFKLYLRDNSISKQGLDKMYEFITMKKGIQLVDMKGNQIDKSLTTSYIKQFSNSGVILLV